MRSSRKGFEIESQNLVTYVVPIFENNYVFLGQKKASKDVFIVDPGSASEILNLIHA